MAKVNLSTKILSLSHVFKFCPNIEKITKIRNRKEYESLGFVIVSQPPNHIDVSIYGMFVFDKTNIKFNLLNSNKKHKPEVKQDYIAFNRKTKECEHYSGLSKSLKRKSQVNFQIKHIKEFCKKFGKDSNGYFVYYGCNNRLVCPTHHYKDETDQRLPKEMKVKIKVKIDSIRNNLLSKTNLKDNDKV